MYNGWVDQEATYQLFTCCRGNALTMLRVNDVDPKEMRYTGCPRMLYTQKCKILRIFITIKTIEFGILIYFSDRAVLLAFLRILNHGNRLNQTKNT